MADQSSAFEQWFVKSSYQEFVKQEGLPMYEGSALENLAGLSLADWERRGKAAYTRLGNQEDYNLQIVEIPPRATSCRSCPASRKTVRRCLQSLTRSIAASPRDRTRNGVTLRLEPLDQSG